jgi:hypothetical protein
MANTLKDSEQNVICGLGTWTHTTANTNMYFVKVHCEEVPTSTISITISQTGSQTASVTSTAPSAAQAEIDLQKIFNCAQGDVISVAISSSSSIDEQLNTVKTTVVVHQGQGQ